MDEDNGWTVGIFAECGAVGDGGCLDLGTILSEETLAAIWREAGPAIAERVLQAEQRRRDPRYTGDYVTASGQGRRGSARKTALYLIRVGDKYKIGISNNPESRLAQIQTGSHLPAEILEVCWFDSRGLAEWAESLLHDGLAEFRVRGEWFDLKEQPSLDRLVEELCG